MMALRGLPRLLLRHSRSPPSSTTLSSYPSGPSLSASPNGGSGAPASAPEPAATAAAAAAAAALATAAAASAAAAYSGASRATTTAFRHPSSTRRCYLESRRQRHATAADSGGDAGPTTEDGRMRRNRPRPPPRFGRTLPAAGVDPTSGRRSYSSGGSSASSDATTSRSIPAGGRPNPKDKDCPLCRKYSQGPCGALFKSWLDCTDAHPGVDPKTGEELHLIKCMELAEPLADCLRVNEEFYAGIALDYDGEDGDAGKDGKSDVDRGSSMDDLAEAWTELIAEVESDPAAVDTKTKRKRKRANFPSHIRPEMEVRLESGWGVAAFAPAYDPSASKDDDQSRGPKDDRTKAKPLILAYLKDQDGTILGAGSGQDLEGTGGMIRFGLQRDEDGGTAMTEVVTACALYGGEDEDVLYYREARLPPR